MTPKQIQLHNHCECSIRWKLFQGRTDPTPGLFCKQHNKWIQWLKDHEAFMLLDSGIAEEIYVPIVKVKKSIGKKRLKNRKKIKQLNYK